jgi:hypothetical protein
LLLDAGKPFEQIADLSVGDIPHTLYRHAIGSDTSWTWPVGPMQAMFGDNDGAATGTD